MGSRLRFQILPYVERENRVRSYTCHHCNGSVDYPIPEVDSNGVFRHARTHQEDHPPGWIIQYAYVDGSDDIRAFCSKACQLRYNITIRTHLIALLTNERQSWQQELDQIGSTSAEPDPDTLGGDITNDMLRLYLDAGYRFQLRKSKWGIGRPYDVRMRLPDGGEVFTSGDEPIEAFRHAVLSRSGLQNITQLHREAKGDLGKDDDE